MIPSHKLPRAKAKVFAHLQTLLAEGEGTRLPTTKMVADQLGVSISTVQSVYKTLSEEGVIRSEVGNGTFLLRPATPSRSNGTMRIGITFGFSAQPLVSEPWHLAVCGSILAQAATSQKSLEVIPMQIDPMHFDQNEVEACARRLNLDGLVLRATAGSIEEASSMPKPKIPHISLRPALPSTTSNFVAPDAFATGFRMGRAFMQSNRKRIVYIHIGDSRLAANSTMICSGIVAALGNALLEDVRFGVTSLPTASTEEVDELFRRLWANPDQRPDAVCTRSIKVTSEAYRFFERHGVDCPVETSLIGADDLLSPNVSKPGLTIVKYNTESLASHILSLLVRRIDSGGGDVPGAYVREDFGGFATTLPEENKVLSAPPPWALSASAGSTSHS
jgi:DNA-binding LacI/PurR family transcriptional regulator